ncbi:hypothetical protein K6L44_15925 [Gluconacetobacter entanii]|uniref:hypothetical protein n=1 Tax=Gluconacetobacter entanii TaxID=108528 RepID=UPI001C9326A0|nr:hypothetical protein [Gluconacetobacter entanii]MBY4641445.1 hypothetical protein [Gluconacetobacter entanii]MCW4582008.1 hypothetical protein [Gluconacetobacter entanii]MCW4585250.1 hypothetical protein [Gluconacetobacter entanii]MCW4588827.1 hypothetical protein [Gluconacetobacter entanii]
MPDYSKDLLKMNLHSMEIHGHLPSIVWWAVAIAIVVIAFSIMLGVLGHYGAYGKGK